MATLTSQLLVKLIDGVSGPAAKAGAALRRLAGASEKTVGAPFGSMAAIRRDAGLIKQNARQVAGAVSLPLALLGALGAKTAFEFEKAGNLLEALGDTTAQQRKEFEAFANTLNAKYPQSLTEILNTGTELLKAGLDFKQMIGALDPTLATAIMGDMKPSEVATMISSSINAFQLPKETMEQAMQSTTTIADRLTYSAVKSTASLRDMGEMFKYVAGAAGATGSTIDDVTAMAMAFSQNKVNGSEAGIALRSAIVRLVKMPNKGLAAMERIGLNIKDYQKGQQKITTDRIVSSLMAGGIDADGKTTGGIDATPIRKQIDALVNDPALQNAPLKMAAKVTALVQEHLTKSGSAIDASVISEAVQESIVSAGSKIDLMKFFDDLKKKLADGTAGMGDVAAILEGRHFSRYQAILAADLHALKETIEKEAAGYTEDRYKVVLKGIVGPTYELFAAIEKLAVNFFRAILPEVTAGFKGLADAVDRMSQANTQMLKFVTYAGLATVALVPIGIAVTAISSVFGVLVGALGLLLSPIGLIVAGVVALGAAIYYFRDKIGAGIEAAKEWGAAMWEGIKQYASGSWDGIKRLGTTIHETIMSIHDGMHEVGAMIITKLWEGMKSAAANMLSWVTSIGSSIKSALSFGGGGATPSLPNGAPLPARAEGGPINPGQPTIVGEKGPEIITASRSGFVHPNSSLGGGGSITVSIPTINVYDASDAKEIATVLVDTVREAMRGVQADYGFKFA